MLISNKNLIFDVDKFDHSVCNIVTKILCKEIVVF